MRTEIIFNLAHHSNTNQTCSINNIDIEVNQCSIVGSYDNFEGAFEDEVEPNGGALKQKIHSFSGQNLAFLGCSIKKIINGYFKRIL